MAFSCAHVGAVRCGGGGVADCGLVGRFTRRVHGCTQTSTLALTTSRPDNHACLHRGPPLVWFFLPLALLDCCRLEGDHVKDTFLASTAPSPMLADAASATLLAVPALPPMLADAAAAAVFAIAALPPVLAEAAAAALLAGAAPPPVLAEAFAAALLAEVALSPVLAEAFRAAALLPPCSSLCCHRRRPLPPISSL